MLLPMDPEAVKMGFDLVRGAIDTLKGVRDLLPAKADAKATFDKRIALAERELALGEAQLAQALGYELCRAHFPPVPMLLDRVHQSYAESISKCPQCGREHPTPEYFGNKERLDRGFDNYNARLTGDWMSS